MTPSEDKQISQRESWGRKFLLSLVTIPALVIVGVLVGVLMEWEPVTSLLKGPTCEDHSELVEVRGVTAQGDHLVDGDLSYPASNLLDGATNTAWADGRSGTGEGSKISFLFDKGTELAMICIANGYGKSWDLYQRNARVREVLLEGFDSSGRRTESRATLEDNGTAENPVVFQEVKPPSGTLVRMNMTILHTYAARETGSGPPYEDATLTEIVFWAAN